MVVKREVDVDVIRRFVWLVFLIGFTVLPSQVIAQELSADSISPFKKRVLESTEVDFLVSYYSQDGDNAAVSGGKGSQAIRDIAPSFVVSIPLNDDDVLSIDASISAYSSASSSNINPFDGSNPADPFVASSGASSSDVWTNGVVTYSHSSDDRNKIWTAKISGSSEFDYASVGVGGSFTRLFNDKNTELSAHANSYFDTWHPIYPYELRPFMKGGYGFNDRLFFNHTILGNVNYSPSISTFDRSGRNSYSAGIGFAQILSSRLQISLALDYVLQEGLLSTPFHRIYFADVEDSYIEDFQLADDIEQLPARRYKIAAGGRLNYYINDYMVLRTYYRYYTDEWNIRSNTLSVELPVKLTDKIRIYPSCRFYDQSAARYFAPYEQHLSSEEYFTSDYDLSEFTSWQYGIGASYTDIFTSFHILNFGLKTVEAKLIKYEQDYGLRAFLVSAGCTFVMD